MAGNAVIGALRVDLGLDTAAFEDGLKKVDSSISGAVKGIAVAAAGIGAAFTAGVTAAVYRMEAMEASSRKVDQVLANTGNTANTSAKEIAAWADVLETRTGRAAEEVMGVAANLASYGFGEEVFFRAIELADDMAAAWGGDLRQNLDGLARALENPEKGLAMLSARGITFTAEGKKMAMELAKVGKSGEAAAVLMDELESQVKGAAEAGFTPLARAQARATKAMEDFFEGVASGAGAGGLLASAFNVAASAIELATAHIGTLTKVAVTAGVTMAVAFSPALLGQIRAIAIAIDNQLVAAVTRLNMAIARNPMGALAVGITAAATALTLFRHDIHPIAGEAASLGDYMAAAWAGVVPHAQAAGAALQTAAQTGFQRWWEATRQTANMLGEWTGLWKIGANEVADANSQAAEETAKKWGWGIDETIRELSFLGAAGVATKDAFMAAFDNFPALMKDVAAQAMNAFLEVVEWALGKVTSGLNSMLSVVNSARGLFGGDPLEEFQKPDLSEWKREGTGAAADVASTFSQSFAAARADIEGTLDGALESWRTNALDLSATRAELDNTAIAVRAFGSSVDEALGGGGAGGASGSAGGAGGRAAGLNAELQEVARLFEQTRTPLERYNAQVQRLSELLQAGKIDQDLFARGVAKAGEELERANRSAESSAFSLASAGQSVGNAFSTAFSGIVDGSKKVKDVLSDVLKQLSNMALNSAFQSLFGGLFGGSAGKSGGGFLGALFGSMKLPEFSRGGTVAIGATA